MRVLFILLTVIFLSTNLFATSIDELNQLKPIANSIINTAPPTDDEEIDKFKEKIQDNISQIRIYLSEIIQAKEKISNLDDLIRKIKDSEAKIGKKRLELLYYKRKLLKLQDVKVLTDAWKQYSQNKTWDNFRNLYKLTKGIDLPEDYSKANPGLKDYDLIAQIIYFQDIRPKRVVDVCEALVKIATKLVELPELIASTITDPVGTAIDTAKEMLTDTILEKTGLSEVFGVSTIVKTITGDGGIGSAINEVQGIAENMAQESLENAKQTLYGLKEMDEEEQKNVSLEDLRKKISDTIDKAEKIIEEENKTLSSYKEQKKELEQSLNEINSYISDFQNLIQKLQAKLASLNNNVEEKDKLVDNSTINEGEKLLKKYCDAIGIHPKDTKLAIDEVTSFFTGYPTKTFLEIIETRKGYIEYKDYITKQIIVLQCSNCPNPNVIPTKETVVERHKLYPKLGNLEKIKYIVKIKPTSIGKIEKEKLEFKSEFPEIDNTSIVNHPYSYEYCAKDSGCGISCENTGEPYECDEPATHYWQDLKIESTKECSATYNLKDIIVYGLEKIGLNIKIFNDYKSDFTISKDSGNVSNNIIYFIPKDEDNVKVSLNCEKYLNNGEKTEKSSFKCSNYLSIFIDGKKEKIDSIKLFPQEKPLQIDIKVPEELNFPSYFSFKIYPVKPEFKVDYPNVYDIVEEPAGSGQLIYYIPIGEAFTFSVNVNSKANLKELGYFVEFHINESIVKDINGNYDTNEITENVQFKDNKAIYKWQVSDLSQKELTVTMTIKDKNNNIVDICKKVFNIQPIKIVKNIEFVNDNISILSTDFFYPYGKYNKFERIEQPYNLKLTFVDNSEEVYSMYDLESYANGVTSQGKHISKWFPYKIMYYVSSKADINMGKSKITWDGALKRAGARNDNTLIFENDKFPVKEEWGVGTIVLSPKTNIILTEHSDNLSKKYDSFKSVSDTFMISTNTIKLYTKDNKKYLMAVITGPAILKNYKAKWVFYDKTITTQLTKADNGDYFSIIELKDGATYYNFDSLQIVDFMGNIKAETSSTIVYQDPDFKVVEYDKQPLSIPPEVEAVSLNKNEVNGDIKKILFQVCEDKDCNKVITGNEIIVDKDLTEDNITLFSQNSGISCGEVYFYHYIVKFDNGSWNNWSTPKSFKLAGDCSFECSIQSPQYCTNEINCNNAGGIWDNNSCQWNNAQLSGVIKLVKGWNLKALPVDVNVNVEVFNKSGIKTIWKWSGVNWKVWSPNNEIISLLNQYKIEMPEHIKSAEGFWVNSSDDLSINIGTGDEYGIEKINLTSGWNLVGCGKNVYGSEFKYVKTLWQWTGSNWKVWSPEDTITSLLNQYKIEIADEIKAGEGFWINK